MRDLVKKGRDLRKRFQLERKLARLQEECDRAVRGIEFIDSLPVRSEFEKKIDFVTTELDCLVSASLVNKAERLNIGIPNDCWEDESDEMFPGFPPLGRHLHQIGQRTVRKLIRKERRESIEWWVKVIGPIFTLIVSILGLVVAVITVSRRK